MFRLSIEKRNHTILRHECGELGRLSRGFVGGRVQEGVEGGLFRFWKDRVVHFESQLCFEDDPSKLERATVCSCNGLYKHELNEKEKKLAFGAGAQRHRVQVQLVLTRESEEERRSPILTSTTLP